MDEVKLNKLMAQLIIAVKNKDNYEYLLPFLKACVESIEEKPEGEKDDPSYVIL